MHSKIVAKKGSLTIPRAVREATGILPGCAVDIVPSAGGYLIVRPHLPVCIICGSQDDVAEIEGHGVCRSCTEQFAKVYFGTGGDRRDG